VNLLATYYTPPAHLPLVWPPRLSTGGELILSQRQARACELQDLYFELHERGCGRWWNTEETMLGFIGDVGDLAKLVLAADGVRGISGR
jgi:hypothetical protein